MFRTELPLIPHPQQLPPSARVLTIGSCFADSIGRRLTDYKVGALVNPFGTVFNPITACQLLRAAAGEDMDWQQHLVEARGRWQSYDLHASVGADNPVALLQQIQGKMHEAGAFLAQADVVVLTLGTAFVYRLKETQELVSNCHKMPAEGFEKELLTPDEIINAVAETHAYLRRINPKLRFVLTVSPVRHLKDTLPLNAVSKSVLRVACHYLSELLPDVSYFPAYELLVDDLRDYRFYAADMLHPSSVAEDYIWEKFTRTYFDQAFGRFKKEWESIRQALAHRPLYAAAPEHRQFLEQTLERLERISAQASVQTELAVVRQRLAELPLPPAPIQLDLEPEDDEERIDIGEGTSTNEAKTPAAPEWVQASRQPLAPAEISEQEEEDGEEEAEQVDTLAEAVDAVLESEQPLMKKKRRSRGGAKRNKKKHAARLAAEALTAAASVEAEAPADLAPVAVEPAAELTQALPPAPPTVIIAQEDAPLQTALERRKRNSRRSKNRKPALPDTLSAAVTGLEEAAAAPVQPQTEPTSPLLTSAPVEEPAVFAPSAENQPTAEPASPEAESEEAGSRREGRTGRSASERRAAAVRKPHRPAARFKPLYAADNTPIEAGETTVPAEASAPATELPPVAPQMPSLPAPTVAPVAASAEARPAVLPAAPLIPDTVNTGSSGTLSETGVATRKPRPSRAKQPVLAAEVVPEATPVAPPDPVVEPAAAAAPLVPKPKRPRPKKATPAPEAAAAPAPESKPAPKRRAKAPAAQLDQAPAPEAPAPADVPATPAPKRTRPPRRKPAGPEA
ncbi:hypothetical protein HER32_05640 [Hymenobacter sp. BT18]|uniref:GSCFA domain-containing protein n=1 Tax=Hymenobacter sp. BT18 TaxID=2835648 RepID=UPI00143EA61E|nr:GSCFA domain-containing protein [Hymenobacter sp. BT18]QIX60684.1 hypothetical protein HER32_05640 [Hymenobacter sp. BT18]